MKSVLPFYVVKFGFAGVYLFSLFLIQNIDRRGGSDVYPQSMFEQRYYFFSNEKLQYLQLKFS